MQIDKPYMRVVKITPKIDKINEVVNDSCGGCPSRIVAMNKKYLKGKR